MTEPFWIERHVLLAVHGELLARFGGLDGIRDAGMLDSALQRAVNLFHYGESSVFEMAAAYAAGIVKNHPFLDGNKRTGFMAAYIFLRLNGYLLQAPEEQAVVMTRGLAAGDIAEAAYAQWLQDTSAKRS